VARHCNGSLFVIPFYWPNSNLKCIRIAIVSRDHSKTHSTVTSTWAHPQAHEEATETRRRATRLLVCEGETPRTKEQTKPNQTKQTNHQHHHHVAPVPSTTSSTTPTKSIFLFRGGERLSCRGHRTTRRSALSHQLDYSIVG
jgi:hypothetical protein